MADGRRPGRAVLAFLAGLIGGYALVLGGYIFFTVLFDYHDFEGAAAMGVAFFVAPVGGFICAVAAAAWAARR